MWWGTQHPASQDNISRQEKRVFKSTGRLKHTDRKGRSLPNKLVTIRNIRIATWLTSFYFPDTCGGLRDD